jgi:hypothetical protein
VIGYVPAATAAPTATVAVEVSVVPLSVAGLNVTVTPVGAPLLVRATSPVKFVRVNVTVDVPDAPACTESVAGFVEIEIAAAGAVTVSVSVAVAFEMPVPLPVIVIVWLPGATAAPTSTVTVAVFAVVLAGLIVTVTPVGAPLAASATEPVKLLRVIVRFEVPDAPAATDSVVGASASEIPEAGGAVTVTVNVVVAFDTPVPLPVIVMA